MDLDHLKREVLSTEIGAALGKALGVDTSRAVSMSIDMGTDLVLVRVAYTVNWAMIAEVASSLANARPVGTGGPRRKAIDEPPGYMMASPEELASLQAAADAQPFSREKAFAHTQLRRAYCTYADDPEELAIVNELRGLVGLSSVTRLTHPLGAAPTSVLKQVGEACPGCQKEAACEWWPLDSDFGRWCCLQCGYRGTLTAPSGSPAATR